MDLSNLMQMAQQLRETLTRAQADAANTRYTGEAGGGMVKVVMSGNHEVLEVKIDPKAAGEGVDPSALAFLEDLLRAAVNQASQAVAAEMQDRLGSMAQGLGLDLSGLNVGGGPKGDASGS